MRKLQSLPLPDSTSASKSSRSLAALNSRCRRTMAGLPLVDEVIQWSRAAVFYWQVASACS
jgi:hypothetical protein